MTKLQNINSIYFSIEEDLPVVLLKVYNVRSFVKGYLAYMKKWNTIVG